MYKICPKCGNETPLNDGKLAEDCPACGLVFSKWLKTMLADHSLEEAEEATRAEETWQKGVKSFFFHPRPDIGNGDFMIFLLIFLVFFAWGIDFITMDFRTNDIGQSWLHNVDLAFHEAGHIIFSPFGLYVSILGGSLFQILVPLIILFVFLFANRDGFGASICLWWVGQNIMDIAPYVADARVMQLTLITGGTGMDSPGLHDWANLLRPLGLLQYDVVIAMWVHLIGAGVLLIGLAWSVVMLTIYYKELMN